MRDFYKLIGRLISGFVGRLVSGLISGLVGGFVRWFVSLGVTVVLHVSDVARVAIDVIVDSLTATVGEEDIVRSSGLVTISVLAVAKVQRSVVVSTMGVVVLHAVSEVIVSGGLL